jgi:diacylglycerol kinase (ATP)
LRALAILGPNASAREADAFDCSRCSVSVGEPSADLKDADAVLVFGGDGTIHRYLAILSRSGAPVLVVPHGSGNDFARSVGIVNRSQAAVAWRRFCAGMGNVRDVDLGVIRAAGSETLFCCVASAGLDADANRRANNFPRWLRARGGYLLAGITSAITFRPQHFDVRADARIAVAMGTAGATASVTISEPGLLVACANAPVYGDGLRIAPDARLDDGLLDICFVPAMSRTRLLLVARMVLSGTHVRLPEVRYFKTKCARLEPDPPLQLYADGELVCQTPVEVSVREKALRIIG